MMQNRQRMAPGTIDSRIWLFHAYFVLVWPAVLVGGGVLLALDVVLSSAAVPIGEAAGLLFFAATAIAAFGSFIGYYFEAERFRAADSTWVPTWWAYMIGHVLLTPFVVAPIYLLQRYRHRSA